MKNTLIVSLILAASLTAAGAAETTITLSGVHNCCRGCTNGIVKAAEGIKDTTVTAEGKKVTIVAKSKANAKKAAEAIIAAGYYGTSDAEAEKSASSSTGLPKPAKKLTSATVSGAHLCCGKCVTAVQDALKEVPGITKSEVVSKKDTFTVEGEFTEADLTAALNKAGFNGTIK